MNVLIIGFSKIKYMPYLNMHLEKYKNDNIELIYWNRDNLDDIKIDKDIITYEFKSCIKENKINKFFSFLKFKYYAKKIIKSKKYDRIVFMHTFPAFLLYNYVKKIYKHQYIFDYRDITYENYPFFKRKIHKIVENSKYTFISSPGFLKVLPRTNNIFITHNITLNDLKYTQNNHSIIKEKDKISISFWGFIRDIKVNLKLIDLIGNNENFLLNYYGFESNIVKKLKQYVKDHNFKNINFFGSYRNEDKIKLVKNTDIIDNMYDYTNYNQSLAITNKFYDGIIYKLPQICQINSLMGEIVEKNGLGIMVDLSNDNALNLIRDYLINIDWEQFNKNCENYLDKVIKEYNISLELK